QHAPAVTADGAGDFVVVWESGGSAGSDTSGLSIQGQRYDSAGTPVGGQFPYSRLRTGRRGREAGAVGGVVHVNTKYKCPVLSKVEMSALSGGGSGTADGPPGADAVLLTPGDLGVSEATERPGPSHVN